MKIGQNSIYALFARSPSIINKQYLHSILNILSGFVIKYSSGVFPTIVHPFIGCFMYSHMHGMSRQHCENYDIKQQTVHCYSEMLTSVARDRRWPQCCRWLQNLFLFCWANYNKSLNDWSGQWILFPSNLNVTLDCVSGSIGFSGNNIHCSPRDIIVSIKSKTTRIKLSY